MVGLEYVLGFPRVLPPPGHDVRLDRSPLGPQMVQGLRDLEFVAPRRLQRPDDREDVLPKQVDPDEGQVALRCLRLLDEGQDVPLRIEFRHPEFLRARDVAQHDLRVVAVLLDLADHRADAALEDVVPEVHAEGLVSDERLGAPDRMGDARGESLDDVRDPHAMGTAVPEEFLHLFRHEVAEDHADVRDARIPKVIEAVQDVRLVRERDQLLRARVRERSKPGPVAPRQDESLHPDTPDSNRVGGTKLSRLRCSLIAAMPSSAERTAIRWRFAFALERDAFRGRSAFRRSSAERTGWTILGSRPNATTRRTAKSY